MFETSGSNIDISETVKASNMDNTHESELLENIPASIWTNIASYLDKPDQKYIMLEEKTSGSNIDDSEIAYYVKAPNMDSTRESELLGKIPASILTNIASYLHKKDQKNLRRVSRVWRNAVEVKEFWQDQKVILHHMEFYTDDVWITFSIRNITKLELKSSGKAEHNNKLGLVMSHLENLSYLELDCVFLHDLAMHPNPAVKNNQVKTLKITIKKHKNNHKCSQVGASRQYFPQLQILHLYCVNKLDPRSRKLYDKKFGHGICLAFPDQSLMVRYTYVCPGVQRKAMFSCICKRRQARALGFML